MLESHGKGTKEEDETKVGLKREVGLVSAVNFMLCFVVGKDSQKLMQNSYLPVSIKVLNIFVCIISFRFNGR